MIYTIIGFFAGIIGGMGMGGGTILIPALVMFVGVDPKIAQSINLLSSIPMAIFALAIHIKNKNVILKLVLPIATFGVLGAICGAFLANYLSSEILKKAFGGFLFLVGCFEIKKGFSENKTKKSSKLKEWYLKDITKNYSFKYSNIINWNSSYIIE